MFIKVTNGVPADYSIQQLKDDNPGTSFPRDISDALLANFSVYRVHIPTAPDFDPDTQARERTQTATLVGDRWEHSWSVRELTAEEIDKVTAKKRDAMKVSMRQARLALLQSGKLSLVDDAIALIPEPDKTAISIEWEYASVVDRNSPWMGVMAAALGLNDEELDELFNLAATL